MRRNAQVGLLVCCFVVFSTGAVLADNGEIAYAYPASGITIDGDLSEWPGSAQLYPIDRVQGNAATGPTDFEAGFRVAYDIGQRLLFVGVEVRDDSHVVSDADDASWTSQDSFLLYLDPVHQPGRTAPILFQSGEQYRLLTLADRRPKPTEKPESWDDVEITVVRKGDRTIYEWQVQMGESFRVGRSIGIDFLLFDEDENRAGGTYFHWGRQLGKSSNAGRLGDLVLLPEEAPLGMARGYLVWDSPTRAALPGRVRFRSTEQADVWVDADVDEGGRFQLWLPEGSYDVELVYSIAEPFGGWDEAHGRVGLQEAASLEVASGEINDAGTLRVVHHRVPDYLIPKQGVLAAFDGQTRSTWRS